MVRSQRGREWIAISNGKVWVGLTEVTFMQNLTHQLLNEQKDLSPLSILVGIDTPYSSGRRQAIATNHYIIYPVTGTSSHQKGVHFWIMQTVRFFTG